MTDNRLEALKQALKMEADAKAFYEKALNRAENKLAKDIFGSLIRAEEKHVQKVKRLYTSLEETGKWPDIVLIRDGRETAENIFAAAMTDLTERVKGSTTDIEALKMAAQLEDKGMKYYQARADRTDDPFEKKFYLLLLREEGEHYISILDSIEFLEDPQGYFSQLERGTLSF